MREGRGMELNVLMRVRGFGYSGVSGMALKGRVGGVEED